MRQVKSMTLFMREHEAYINRLMEASGDMSSASLEELKNYHLTQIGFLQHERLVHLMVTLAFAFFFIISLAATWFYLNFLLLILDLLLLILLLFYIVHYYRLENTVQRWYRLHNTLCEMKKPSH